MSSEKNKNKPIITVELGYDEAQRRYGCPVVDVPDRYGELKESNFFVPTADADISRKRRFTPSGVSVSSLLNRHVDIVSYFEDQEIERQIADSENGDTIGIWELAWRGRSR